MPRQRAPQPDLFAGKSLSSLRAEAADCRACPLWKNATQTVFGEGPDDAEVMLVGEQPGDKEDLAGRPFVGPAGQILDRALQEAGIERAKVYVTNAVKHFKFTPRGKSRLHQKPNTAEIKACRRWFEAERGIIRPRLIVALGATGAYQVFGRAMPIGKSRGRLLPLDDEAKGLVTVHPSFILRLREEDERRAEYARLVADLRLVEEYLETAKQAA